MKKKEAQPSGQELYKFLQGRLPSFMLPAAITVVEALPMTPNGKVDRHGARTLEKEAASAQQEYRAPESMTEELLGEIWRELLHLEKVSVSDNFFVLGGHSLLAMRMISLIREKLEVELSPAPSSSIQR